MITTAFFSAFNFIANNKWAQIALTIGLIIFAWRANNVVQRRRGEKRYRVKVERARADEKARAIEHITTIRKGASDEADQAIEAGNAAGPVDSSGMSDRAYARTFGRPRPTG